MKPALIFIHKWLGISLALLFLMWFFSGVVLYYVPFPNLTQAERRAGLQPLAPATGCCLMAEEAAGRAGVAFTEARLGMAGEGTPVWRLLVDTGDKSPPRWQSLDARAGARMAPLTSVQAMRVAETFSGRRALGAEGLERDQWTVPQGLDPYRPLLKVSLEGGDGLELYVSSTAAEVVRDTRRAERFWNWIGAVPHWIYPTVLRQFPQAWNQVVVWLSIPGVLLAATGLVLGIWQLFLNRLRWIPYRKFWMRWHHIAGLVAAVFTFTWIFSGLMSMNPYGVFSSLGLSAAERDRWLGADQGAAVAPQLALAAVAARETGAQPLELERIRIDGQVWYRIQGTQQRWWVRADDGGAVRAVESVLPDGSVSGALRRLRGVDRPPSSVTRIDRYDDVYYAKNPASAEALDARPLPVWRAHWPDGTDLYADVASGKVLLRVDPSGRWQRLLYQGLHSLDFEPLRERPWLRDALVPAATASCPTKNSSWPLRSMVARDATGPRRLSAWSWPSTTMKPSAPGWPPSARARGTGNCRRRNAAIARKRSGCCMYDAERLAAVGQRERGRFRQVPVPAELVEELGDELARHGFERQVGAVSNQGIHVMARFDTQLERPVGWSASGLYQAIKAFFALATASADCVDAAVEKDQHPLVAPHVWLTRTAGHCRAGQGRAGQGREGREGQGRAGKEGQGREGKGRRPGVL